MPAAPSDCGALCSAGRAEPSLSTHVLSMATAVWLRRAPLAHAAIVSLVACTAVFFFVGTLLAWVAAVAACALAYQRLAQARRR